MYRAVVSANLQQDISTGGAVSAPVNKTGKSASVETRTGNANTMT